MTKSKLDRFKKNYEAGFLTYEMIENMFKEDKITKEEFDYIVGK